MARQEPHVHEFKKLGFIREVGTTSRNNKLVPDALGKVINRVILIRSCECGKSQAFECGGKNEMRVLFARLSKKLEGVVRDATD